MNKTLTYYNENASKFVATTVDVNFTEMQDRFLAQLEQGAYILDFGCGSGRDSKYFIDKGYEVEAIDGSEELCKIASEFAGIEVKHMLFDQLDEVDKYDGIWACSSILHVPYEQLPEILKKMAAALKEDGLVYTSFKYGTFEGERNGRYFTDLNENMLAELLASAGVFEIKEQWITSDVRPGRDEEKWLNVILKKI